MDVVSGAEVGGGTQMRVVAAQFSVIVEVILLARHRYVTSHLTTKKIKTGH